MYIDQQRKKRRANNIVISGLPVTDNDAVAVTELLRDEFEWDVTDWPGVSVAKCRRLGMQQQNKVQPLLVTLNSREQAAYYIKNARTLRASNTDIIKNSVYINADLTQSEAKAAYELRIQRKRRQQKEQTGRTFYHSHHSTAVATTSQAASTPVEELTKCRQLSATTSAATRTCDQSPCISFSTSGGRASRTTS